MRTRLTVHRRRKRGSKSASVSRRVWCTECVCDNAEALHRWAYRGVASARGGALRVELCCTACRRPLAVGTYAEAVTLHGPGVEFQGWEGEVVLLTEGGSGDGSVELSPLSSAPDDEEVGNRPE